MRSFSSLGLLCFLVTTVRGQLPTTAPSDMPSRSPSSAPSVAPVAPSAGPSPTPSAIPSDVPSSSPTTGTSPTATPSAEPSDMPSNSPIAAPPSANPSLKPSDMPSSTPTLTPGVTSSPSEAPSDRPSIAPTNSALPSGMPSSMPSTMPSFFPSSQPSSMPSVGPTVPPGTPTMTPSARPSSMPSVSQPEKSATRVLTMVLINWNQPSSGRKLQISNTDNLEEPINETFELYWGDGLVPSSRRRLQTEDSGIVLGRSQANVVDQDVQGDTNTLTYEQTIFYRETSDNAWTADEILSNTYDDAAFRDALLDGWQAREPEAFADVSADALLPEVFNPTTAPTPTPTDDGDGGLTGGAIAGIVIGGVVALCIVMVLIMKCQERGDKGDAPPARFAAAGEGEDVSTIQQPASVAGGYGDQSVATVDYDYSKAYGGAGSVVSSAGGTMGENTRFTSENAATSALGVGATASFDANVKEEVIEIQAPSGKLGVVIDTPDDGAPVVHAVKDSSVIADLIQVGDKLIAVDDDDVTSMTAIKVSKLISKKSANSSRKLTVIRTSVVEEP